MLGEATTGVVKHQKLDSRHRLLRTRRSSSSLRTCSHTKTASAVGEVATGVVDTATGVVTDVKDVVVDTAKKLECEKKWSDEIGSVSRFASAEAMEKSKSDYVSTCLASK